MPTSLLPVLQAQTPGPDLMLPDREQEDRDPRILEAPRETGRGQAAQQTSPF